MLHRVAALFVVLVLLITGCGSAAKTSGGSAPAPSAPESKSSNTSGSEPTPTTTAVGTTWPARMPLPQMPGAKLVQGQQSTLGGKIAFDLALSLPGTVTEAADFYEKAAKSAGLTVNRMESKADKYTTVVIRGESAKVEMQIGIRDLEKIIKIEWADK